MCAASTVADRQKGSAMNYQHFLITRFNVRMPWKSQHWGADPEWCSRRADLFERYCLPAVANQTASEFQWLVLFDNKDTPDFLKSRFDEYSRRAPQFCAVAMGPLTSEEIRDQILSRTPGGVDRIVMTRLDTDDVIVPEFIEQIQSLVQVRSGFLGFINFDRGYFHERGRSYLYHSEHNAFFSYVGQRSDTLHTCHDFNHNKIHEAGEVIHVRRGRWYAFLNHDHNISGRSGGNDRRWRVPNWWLYKRFGLDVFLVDESRLSLLFEDVYLAARNCYGALRGSLLP